MEAVTNCIIAGCTGCYNASTDTFKSKTDCDISGTHVRDCHRNIKWGDLVETTSLASLVVFLCDFHAADTAGEDDSTAFRIFLLHIQSTLLECLIRCNNSVLRIAVHTSGILLVDYGCYIQILYLSGKLHCMVRRINSCNLINSADTFFYIIPCCLYVISQRVYSS